VNVVSGPGNAFDVVVVGGGIVGLSAGLRCARAGARVAVVDAGTAGQASAAGAGIVSPVGLSGDEASDEWTSLVASAISHYDGLLGLLGDAGVGDGGFSRVGELVVATRESDVPDLDALVIRLERAARAGVSVGRVERVGGRDLSGSWPELRTDLDGVFIENVARLDGRSMCAAIADLGRLRGAVFLDGHASIELREDRRCALFVDGSPVLTDSIVLAAGAWSQPMLQKLGARIAVRPVRGQIVHLQVAAARTEARPVVNTFEGHYFLGFPGRRVVTGGTHEPEAGFSVRATADGLHSLLAKALRIAPGLGTGTVLETRVGLRPRSADGYPIVGRLSGSDNVVVATGLGSWGLTLGPLVGAVAAEHALGLPSPFATDRLGPDREPIGVPAALSPSPEGTPSQLRRREDHAHS
jgi:D-amino-acid dehydrogenase